ncbi:hypothetical protein FJT64_017616 [Amphibalanus amphitrite]|uniref:Uncharacterized protein n=1 Tax=Amphibalanus amphitrite TaxID=1232801 RepID=A0A6A4XB11_AMPAM|nr:hypothetical protein FJT64_017616 [Amphibalanus amphitrite]
MADQELRRRHPNEKGDPDIDSEVSSVLNRYNNIYVFFVCLSMSMCIHSVHVHGPVSPPDAARAGS